MTNGKTPNLPGAVMRAMADSIAKQATAIADGTEERLKEIQAEAERGLEQLRTALDRYRQTSRDDAAKLAEAVTDQFGVLAQRIDDLTTHCNSAAQAFSEHHKNIVNGLAAIRNEAPLPTTPSADHLDQLSADIRRTIPRRSPESDRG